MNQFKYVFLCCTIFTAIIACNRSSNKTPQPLQVEQTVKNADTIEQLQKPGFSVYSGEMDKRVLSILQDQHENFWFGTNNGVYRYDGNSLVVFTEKEGLVQNQVRRIQEDNTGNLWFSTGAFGVNKFNGEVISTLASQNKNEFKNYSAKNWKTTPDDLWFCAGGGAFRTQKDTFGYFPFPLTGVSKTDLPPFQPSAYGVYCILKDRSGNIWFGTQAMGVCRYDGKSFKWFTAEGLKGPAVLALFEDRKGNMWFGNNGQGLFCYDGSKLINFTSKKGLSNPDFNKNGKEGPGTLARVWSLNEDNEGNLWIGTGDAGVWRYDGINLINYTKSDGVPDAGIETIYKDKRGKIWFGTDGAGIFQWDGKKIVDFNIH